MLACLTACMLAHRISVNAALSCAGNGVPAEVMATVRQMVKDSRGMCARAMRAEGIKVHAPSFCRRGLCAPFRVRV